MKFSDIAGLLLLSSVAIAVPLSEENLAKSEANRLARSAQKQSIPVQRYQNQSVAHTDIDAESYSSNWAGAVLVNSGYTLVTGTFVVPGISVPAGGNSNTQYCAAAWVGIDGDTCQSAIIQTGVNLCIQNGQTSYTAWYEWFPAAQEYWNSGIEINEGDSITATVVASGTSGGTATVTNNNNGQSVSYTFSGQSAQLCETNAEWIVEDLSSGGGLVPFADFGTITFTGAQAEQNGNTVDTSGAGLIDIEQNNQVLTSSSTSGSTVTVRYTG
jgi:hypothetical protein